MVFFVKHESCHGKNAVFGANPHLIGANRCGAWLAMVQQRLERISEDYNGLMKTLAPRRQL
jgi:hypothetical protein